MLPKCAEVDVSLYAGTTLHELLEVSGRVAVRCGLRSSSCNEDFINNLSNVARLTFFMCAFKINPQGVPVDHTVSFYTRRELMGRCKREWQVIIRRCFGIPSPLNERI